MTKRVAEDAAMAIEAREAKRRTRDGNEAFLSSEHPMARKRAAFHVYDRFFHTITKNGWCTIRAYPSDGI